MTREEILKLEPGFELDRLVAEKVMGWEEGYEFVCDGWGLLYYVNFGLERKRPWSPSTNIATAWEVIEHLVPEYNIGLFNSCDLKNPSQGTWYVEIRATRHGAPPCEAGAETAPLAICCAALLAVEAD